MKHLLLSLFIVLAGNGLFAQSGSGWEWASTTGTTAAAPGNQVLDIATDISGNTYVIGRFNSAITIGSFSLPAPVGSDIFIAKYNVTGAIQWLKRHTPPTGYNEVGQVIIVDGDGNVFIGGTDDTPTLSGRAFLAKYDNQGSLLWNKFLTLYEVGGINIGADGNLVVMESNQNGKNIHSISKADGSILWTVTNTNVGSNGATTYRDFVDQAGNIYYTCFTTTATAATIAGSNTTTTGLTSFIVSLDQHGNQRWIQAINNIQVQLGYTIDPDGNSYIAFSGGFGGSFQGYNTGSPLGNRYFELNSNGTVTKAAMTSPYITGRMFRVTPDGIYGVVLQQGSTTAYGFSYGDYLYSIPANSSFALGVVVKYSRTTGAVLWANSFEMTGSAFNAGSLDAFAVSPVGKVAVGGAYGTTIKTGSNTYTTINQATYATDLFVARFDGAGVSAPPFTNWTGAAGNGNWSDAANWSNGLPDGSKKVNIPGGLGSYPTNIPANAVAGKLEIAAGATVRLPLAFSATAGIINHGSIELNESASAFFLGTFANNTKASGSGKIVVKSSNIVVYPVIALEQSLEINSGGTVTSYGGTVMGNLILTNGILSASSFTVQGNVTGGSAASYVAGSLTRTVNANGSYFFPVGSATRYAPVTLQLNNIAGPQNITASFSNTINGNAPAVTVSAQPVNTLLNTGIWTIAPNVPLTAGSYGIALTGSGYNNAVTDAARYVVLKRANASAAWGFYGDNGIASQTSSTVTAAASGITGFSDFAIGIAGGPVTATALPVRLTRFTATQQDAITVLNWETAMEWNNAAFVIERSSEGSLFTAIGQLKGQGNAGLTAHYTFTDLHPQAGNNFYRLQQIDTDGKITYSEIRAVKFVAAGASLQVYPNPTTGRITLLHNSHPVSRLTLLDAAGRMVWTQPGHTTAVTLPTHLVNGRYTLRVYYTDGASQPIPLIIKK